MTNLFFNNGFTNCPKLTISSCLAPAFYQDGLFVHKTLGLKSFSSSTVLFPHNNKCLFSTSSHPPGGEGKGVNNEFIIDFEYDKYSCFVSSHLIMSDISLEDKFPTNSFPHHLQLIFIELARLNNLDDNKYDYKIIFNFFIHSNKRNKLPSLLNPPKMVSTNFKNTKDSSQESFREDLFNRTYKYHGYGIAYTFNIISSFVFNVPSFSNEKDFNVLTCSIIKFLQLKIKDTNESRNNDDFIDFNKSIIIEIIRTKTPPEFGDYLSDNTKEEVSRLGNKTSLYSNVGSFSRSMGETDSSKSKMVGSG